jgi:ribosomal 50S subunit-associated protein YjgA (DUF615 family)
MYLQISWTEANALIARLTPAEAAKLENIPVNASLTGNLRKYPQILKLQYNLTNQLVQQQKERLLTQGNSALSDFITKTKANRHDTSGNSSHKGS